LFLNQNLILVLSLFFFSNNFLFFLILLSLIFILRKLQSFFIHLLEFFQFFDISSLQLLLKLFISQF